ncbi:arginase family protein [Streptomyces sp. RS10V-4]|uniref:arginase family protein n=1 Tax=Streptomyces rhizoryzae TaxID=2932493 RepID=UPI002003ADBD|nr:arginase family protein [Streptomyces rhizoryzae]MCK7622803.1 arginase family protein [Streptomyces rhizoryzae]
MSGPREGRAVPGRSGRLLVVPQWQGSAAGDPHLLAEGAHRLAALLPAARRTVVPVGARPGRTAGRVRHLDVLAEALRATQAALDDWADTEVLRTAGGDCGSELGPVSRAVARHGDELAVVWFDAHADLNTPQSSPSGGFHGMVLRTLLGQGPAELVPPPGRRLAARQVVLAGVRALDAGERRFAAEAGLASLPVAGLADPGRLVAAVAATGARRVYVHLDLDVLDPGHVPGLSCPEPGGLHPDRLAAALDALAGAFPVAGFGVTEYAPADGGGGRGADGSRGAEAVLRRLFAGPVFR